MKPGYDRFRDEQAVLIADFKALPADPRNFDGNHDGVGFEG